MKGVLPPPKPFPANIPQDIHLSSGVRCRIHPHSPITPSVRVGQFRQNEALRGDRYKVFQNLLRASRLHLSL